MNTKCYAILSIVLVLPVLRGDAHAEDLALRSRTTGSVAELPVYPHPPAISIPGVMRPSKDVTMSSPMEGMLMTVHVREGQRVLANAVLATIDDRVVQAAVNLAQASADRTANLNHAREELKLAENLLKRLKTLRSANGGSDYELLEARTRVEQARATVDSEQEKQRQSKCQLDLELARLEAHNIRAPFDGQVVRIHADPGTTLTRDDELLTLIRLDELEVELHVPLRFYGQLQLGHSYPLIAGPPISDRLQGQLTFASPTVDSATQTFRTVFTLHNRDQKLPAGFSVQFDAENLRPLEHSNSLSATTRK